ncbi:MAG: DUF4349 domain-containing protein [Terracidiphilus sp.]|nr:DUF4349 domain-containing protein [Terracidiphilus sp.]
MSIATTHPFTAEELMAFCDGEFSTEETHAVEAHLAECRECADQVRQFRETSQSLREWSAPPVSRRIEDAIEEQLQAADQGRGSRGSKARFGRTSRPRWRPWAIAGASAVAAVLLVAVVGISVESYRRQTALVVTNSDAESPRPSATPEMVSNQLSASSRGGGGGAPLPAPDATTAPSAPLIARSVTLVVVAKDVAAARPTLDAILAKYHGYASEMDVNTPADDAPSLKASLRIPVANLSAAMNDLRGLGRVASESQSGEDVTQQHADLDQRLKTARDTEDRLRTILQQRTGSVGDVLQVEEEIARVRGDIESMEAEQTNLEHRVDFASVDLSVTVDYGPTPGAAPLSVRVRNAFVAGYRNAVGTVVGIFLFLVAYGLTILIWLAILGVPVYLLRRRYRRMHAKL